MSMISEQVKELRSAAEVHKNNNRYMINLLNSAADTIESLSAKLDAANEELKRWHTNHINEKIKNPFANTSTSICHNCDHKDEYIEELEAAKGSGWISCKERLPEENKRVIACFAHGTVTELSFYGGMFNGIYSYNTNVIIAWQPLPQPYHEPSQADPPQAAPWKEHLAQRFGRVE